MTPATTRNRLLAISAIALLIASGAVAGITLRPDVPEQPVLAATTTPETRAAVKQAASLSDAFIAIAETVTPSVVRIEVARSAPVFTASLGLQDPYGRTPPEQAGMVPEFSGGTGFIISADGYILTNHHVIADATRITVMLRDNRMLDAVVVGADPMTDIAVIRIDAQDLPAVTLGDSDAARVGEWVLAIGNPGFADAASTLDFTVTSGIISAKGRPLNILSEAIEGDAALYAIEDFIQTDAVINPGNSGGPLVDLRGTVIGINTAIASTTGYSQGYGFAIPSNLVQRVTRDLIAHGHVRRPLLGISIMDVSPEDAEVYGLPAIAGVVIEDFSTGSPAQAAGLQRHDVIIAVDGVPVDRRGQLQRLIALHQPGDVVPLTIIRYGEQREVRVRLVEADLAAADVDRQSTAPRFPAGLGVEVEELTVTRAQQTGFAEAGGALISRVLPGSAAEAKQILERHRILEINGERISSAADARRHLRSARQGSILSLLIEWPDGRTYIANLRVP